jgi:hypothetical protein
MHHMFHAKPIAGPLCLSLRIHVHLTFLPSQPIHAPCIPDLSTPMPGSQAIFPCMHACAFHARMLIHVSVNHRCLALSPCRSCVCHVRGRCQPPTPMQCVCMSCLLSLLAFLIQSAARRDDLATTRIPHALFDEHPPNSSPNICIADGAGRTNSKHFLG